MQVSSFQSAQDTQHMWKDEDSHITTEAFLSLGSQSLSQEGLKGVSASSPLAPKPGFPLRGPAQISELC